MNRLNVVRLTFFVIQNFNYQILIPIYYNGRIIKKIQVAQFWKH